MSDFRKILQSLMNGNSFSAEEAEFMITKVLENELSPVQTTAWLAASAAKKETSTEIAAYAKVMRRFSKGKAVDFDCIDTCGTGGDNSNLMNISTLSAITLASLGLRVAKHGNRSVSSTSGSADILEAMGYPLEESPEEDFKRLNEENFGFFFAPKFHPAMKYVAPIRKELMVRTVFNILGPLCNPAEANIQLMGVFSKNILDIMANTLKQLGIKAGLVFISEEGYDEVSPVKPTDYRLIYKNEITQGKFNPPQDISFESLDMIQVSSKEDAFKKAKQTLNGSFLPGIETTAVNAALGLFLWELAQKKISTNQMKDFVDKEFIRIKGHLMNQSALKLTESWQ